MKRNPVARKIREPRFRKRVVISKKVYTRKGRSIRPFHIASSIWCAVRFEFQCRGHCTPSIRGAIFSGSAFASL